MIMEATGHRSLEGVRSYKRTSECQKKSVSDILNVKPINILAHTDHSQMAVQQNSQTNCCQFMPPNFNFSACNVIPSISLYAYIHICLHPTTNVLTATEHYNFLSLPKQNSYFSLFFIIQYTKNMFEKHKKISNEWLL